MPDKKYKELSKRLHSTKKTSGNFRSYEEIKLDVKNEENKERERTAESHDSKDKKKEKDKNPSKEKKREKDKKQGKESNTKESAKKSKKTYSAKNPMLPQLMKTAMPFLVGIVVIIAIVYALTNKNAVQIMVNGEIIGQVKAANLTDEQLQTMLLSQLEEIEGTKVKIVDDITLEPVHGKKKLLKDDSEMLNLLSETVDITVLAAEVTVDGEIAGVARSQEEAQDIFDIVMEPYVGDSENVVARFVENVLYTEKYVDKDNITPKDDILAELMKTVEYDIEYEVVSGDTLSKIAAKNSISVSDLKESNKDQDLEKPIQPGQKLRITATMPYVSVETTETNVETVDIPRDVIEQKDSSVPPGQRKIIQQGKVGKKEIVTQTVKINGVLVSSEQVSETILEPSEPQIVAVS